MTQENYTYEVVPEDVCIELESPSTTAAPPPLTTAHDGVSDVASDDPDDLDGCICSCKFCIIFFMLMYPLLSSVIFFMNTSNPTFKVESVSISPYDVSDTNSLMTAKWNIGFSLRNPNKDRTIAYKGINVSFNRTMVAYSTEKVVLYSSGTYIPITFHQGPKNTTLLNATIDASSPQYVPRTIDGGRYLEFDVTIQAHIKWVGWIYTTERFTAQGVCRDMKVGILSNATQGFWLGGPKSCSSSLFVH